MLEALGGVLGQVLKVGVVVADGFELLLAPHVFADGDVFHLGGDDALVGIPFLGDGMTCGFQRFALQAGVFLEFVFGLFVFVVFLSMGIREVAVVCCFDLSSVVFLDITTIENPLAAHGGKSLANVALKIWITPRAGAIVDADGRVCLGASILVFGIGEADFSHGNLDGGVHGAIDIDAS